MKVNVTAKNMALTGAIREYAEKKVTKISKYFDDIMDIQVNLEVQRNLHIAEVLVDVKGVFLKGYEKSEDMYASIDIAVDKIEKQLIKYKERLKDRKNAERKPDEILKLNVYDTDTMMDAEPKIIVSKSIPSKPMDIDEAVMQMDLLNKNFFVFRNSQTADINVVYKRDDGQIGLIES